MMRGQSYLLGSGLALAGLVGFGAVAQDGGGLRANFGFSQSIEASDNFDLSAPGSETSGIRAVTNLSFGLSSTTDRTSLSLSLGGKLEAGNDADSGLVDPTARLNFSTGTRNTKLRLRGSYAETDVNDIATILEPSALDLQLQALGISTGPDELFLGDGTKIVSGVNLSYDVGLQDPVSFSLSSNYSHTGYRDVADPDLFEFESLRTTISTRLRFSDVANLRLGATVSDYRAEDADNTRRDNIRYFANGTYQLRNDLEATASLNYSDNETRDDLGVDRTEGFGFGFGLTKSLPRGTLGVRFNSSVNSDGRSQTLRVTRALDLQDGSVSLSLGVVDTSDGGLEPLADARYSRNLKRGSVTLGLSQRASVNEDDETIINTRLNAAYDARINENSGWGLSLAIANTNTLSVDDDNRRVNLGVNYRRNLNRDWDMVARYTHATSQESGEADRSSNTVSLSVQRSFQYRP